MESIPNYKNNAVIVQGPQAQTPQVSNTTINESTMVFGTYNTNTPALSYMYGALQDSLKQGASLYGNMQELAHKENMFRAENKLKKQEKIQKAASAKLQAKLARLLERGGIAEDFRDIFPGLIGGNTP